MKIKELKIYTTKLEEQTQFYADILGVKIIERSKNSVFFAIGSSKLIIEQRKTATPYHFAINIPSNKEKEGLQWLKNKVGILKDGQEEMIDFVNWNAKAMYFYDADQNIVELIARKNLSNHSNKKFNQDLFLEISEIGLPTENINREFMILNEACRLEVYDGNFEKFCAIGNDHGLFICVNKNIKKWFPTNDVTYSSNFEVIINEKGKEYAISYENEKIKIHTL